MIQPTAQYNPTTRTLSFTDTSVGFFALRRLVRVDGDLRQPLTEPTAALTVGVRFAQDGVYQVALQQVDAEGLLLDESAVFTHLESGSQQQAFADLYLRHAQRPYVRGNDAAYRVAWLRCYSFRAAAAERNPHQARRLAATERHPRPLADLLPALVPYTAAPLGLPVPFTGVQWRVDDPAEGSVTVTTRITAGAGLSAVALAPGQDTGSPLPGAATGELLTFTFPAPTDGVYRLQLRFGQVVAATLLVPVLRTPFRALREQVREEGLTTADRTRRAPERHLPRLARLAAAEAAARTGNQLLTERLIASAAALPEAQKPTHVYPLRNG